MSENEKTISGFLATFSCKEDRDIESFLKNKAIKYEELAKARTYLIVNADEMDDRTLELEALTIYGFVSVTLSVLKVSEAASNNMRKKLDGLNAKKNGVTINEFPCYLIGQLSKNSNVRNNELSGQKLIDIACDIIRDAFETVGGRYIMIECKNVENLIEFYENNEFKEISASLENEKHLIQMIRKIQ